MQARDIKCPNLYQPVHNGIKLFKQRPLVLQDKIARWRGIANKVNLSDKGRLRLEWMIFYETVGNHDAYATAKHFEIAPKTFYKWFNRFDNGRVSELEDDSRKPKNYRKWEVTVHEECRIMKLRKAHMHWGKRKIQKLYHDTYGEEITAWKVERVTRKHELYPDKKKAEKQRQKLKKAKEKKRIQGLEIKDEHWFLFHLDTIALYIGSFKRYILTATDHHGKVAYARMYGNKSSRNAKDFLYRLHYVINARITNIQTDNGSEFFAEFEKAIEELKATHWFSRPRTPKDNSIAERFNQTLEYEWLYDGHVTANIQEFNVELTEFLVEYNFVRPHEALDYQTPFEYFENTLKMTEQQKLLPMYSARTLY
jgi:transposase InsO family protein